MVKDIRHVLVVIGILGLLFALTGCQSVNPLIEPYSNIVNKTLIPRLEQYVKKDKKLPKEEKEAIWYEIQAHRILIRESRK